MKPWVLNIFFFLVFQVPWLSYAQKRELIANFKIVHIERVKNGYAIDLRNLTDSAYYTMVSLKEKHNGFEKLKIGNVYYLKLCSYFPEDNNKYLPDLRIIYEISLKGTTLYVNSRHWTTNIYTSDQIVGKYFKIQKQGSTGANEPSTVKRGDP